MDDSLFEQIQADAKYLNLDFCVFFARVNSLKLQWYFPKVAEGNSLFLHLPFPCPGGHRKVLLQT